MKKLLSLFAAIVAAVSMSATSVVFDFTDTANWTAWGFTLPAAGAGTDLDNQSITKDGVTLSFAKGSGSTTVRIYQGSGNNAGLYDLRLYAGDVLTVSVSGTDVINQISFNAAVTEVGGESKNTFTYADGVTSAQFTNKVTIKNMTVVLNETIEEWVPDTITVSQAKALIDAGDNHDHYVYGRVMNAPFSLSSTHAAWIEDLETPTDSLELYTFKKNATTAWTIDELTEAIIPGDVILVYATSLSKYNTIYETTSCYFVEYMEMAPRPTVEEIAYSDVYVEYDMGTYTVTLSNGNEAQELMVMFDGNMNSLAGTYTIDTETASFGEADAEGTLAIVFNRIEGNSYYYTFKANFTSGDVTYKSNDVIRVAGAYFEDNTNIDAAAAAEIAASLASGATTEIYYDIYGYVSELKSDNNKGNKVFYIADDATSTEQVFYCYGVTWNGAAPQLHDMVHVRAQLKNYNGTLETNYGEGEVVNAADVPELRHGETYETLTVSADQAYQIGLALNNVTSGSTLSTPGSYTVIGYCVKVKTDFDETTKLETFFMANTADATHGDFQAYKCVCDRAVAVGDKVKLTGKIQNYCGTSKEDGSLYNSIEISGATVEHTEEAVPEAILNTVVGEKAAKVVINGEVVIIRNGRRYNLVGARL